MTTAFSERTIHVGSAEKVAPEDRTPLKHATRDDVELAIKLVHSHLKKANVDAEVSIKNLWDTRERPHVKFPSIKINFKCKCQRNKFPFDGSDRIVIIDDVRKIEVGVKVNLWRVSETCSICCPPPCTMWLWVGNGELSLFADENLAREHAEAKKTGAVTPIDVTTKRKRAE